MRVLLGTDGSPDAVLATEWLAHFPLPQDSSIRVVSVVPRLSGSVGPGPGGDFQDSLRAEARKVCEEARLRLSATTVDVRVAEGDVREQLLTCAQDWKADVIVLGRRGLGVLQRAFLGSVSLGVAREARCAVVVVKGPAKAPHRIVVGVDGSEDSQLAVRFLESLPLPADAEIWLVGVAEKIVFPRTAPGLVAESLRTAIAQAEEDDKSQKLRLLSQTEATIRTKARVQLRTVVGIPAEEIVNVARTTDAELVVVGSRGLGGIQRVLLGSVSERVLVEAECSVLIIKT